MNSEIQHPRRRFMAVAAGGSAALAIGGAGVFAADAYRASAYDSAVRATWRHSGSTHLPAPAAQRELVRYATLAANSHNTQPWRFRIQKDRIVVSPDLRRRCPAVDPDDHHLFASLGCATENIVQAASAFGLRADPVFDASTAGIRIGLSPDARRETALFQAIPHRQTTRADFDPRPVASRHLGLLEQAGNGDGVRMLMLENESQRQRMLAYLIAANSAQMDDAAFTEELISWVRFSYGEALTSRDGLFAKATGNPVLPGPIGRRLFRWVFKKNAENRKYERQVANCAGIAVLASDRDDPAHWIEAGRCCQRFALQATALGIRYSFINQPVEVPGVRGQLATYLGLGEGRRPDLVLRFGYGPELPRSLRRPIEQVLA